MPIFDIPDTAPIISSMNIGFAKIHTLVIKTVPTWKNEDRLQFASYIVTLAHAATISDVCLLAHVIKETGLTSERFIKSNNPAGLGATNDGAWGNVFPTRIAGLCAMVGHLINYAVKPVDQTMMQQALASLDPRLHILIDKRLVGTAPRWIDLSQKWGYITDPRKVPPKLDPSAYGMSIVIRARSLANSV